MAKNFTYKPLYIQLKDKIAEDIENNKFIPGIPLPNINKLCDLYGTNRSTLLNAIGALIDDEYLYSIKDSGLFIVENKFEQKIGLNAGFTFKTKLSDYKADKKLKSINKRLAGCYYADIFDIDINDEIIYMELYSIINKKENSLQEIYLPSSLLPILNEVDNKYFNLDALLSFYNIKICGLMQNINLIRGNNKIRKILKLEEKSPIFLVESYYKNLTGRDIIYSREYIRSDKTFLSINL